MDGAFDRIAAALAAEPRGFTHRDYQSRNLMVLPGGEQAVIDFQDALLGPRQYDLVALLRDSYVELDAPLRRGHAPPLPGRAGRGGRPAPRRTAPFREIFDLLTVQRKLKDAGRFVFIDRVRGTRASSSPSRPRCATCARPSRAGPTWRELQAVLARHVPELAR